MAREGGTGGTGVWMAREGRTGETGVWGHARGRLVGLESGWHARGDLPHVGRLVGAVSAVVQLDVAIGGIEAHVPRDHVLVVPAPDSCTSTWFWARSCPCTA
ncbi:hypothetical protein B0T26DRAFT_689086 [Lasiosphaeria miniovina]|uniref:Uncharacterized protein n=1 Tax=Lasiosphaeria miniovina TaxID=1954250 RepID=A0AA40EGJ2_9PEZI|nr:uncharacterized protein B0T26DRAFT_689086 [Lasiosphaeria miniovina]KAK0734613.1 hypothetical protein B0T26DRAFT_689086 [Lasiosphaeria miniovina]